MDELVYRLYGITEEERRVIVGDKWFLINTLRFSDTATAYVKTISKKVILMDGEQLASYMIEYGLGVSTFAMYELKKIDNDYFGE